MDAAGQLAQLGERQRQLLLRAGEHRLRRRRGPRAAGSGPRAASARARRAAAGRRRAGCAPAGGARRCRPRRSGRARRAAPRPAPAAGPAGARSRSRGRRRRRPSRRSSGSSQSERSWISAPTARPSRSTRVTARAGSSSGGQHGGMAGGVDPLARAVEPVDDLQRAVAERGREQVAQVARVWPVADPVQELGHRAGLEDARAQDAEDEAVGHEREQREAEQLGRVRDRLGPVDGLESAASPPARPAAPRPTRSPGPSRGAGPAARRGSARA